MGVFCDLSKAFYCVNQETLIRKLHHYGAMGLLTSYVTNVVQKVDVNDMRSSGTVVHVEASDPTDMATKVVSSSRRAFSRRLDQPFLLHFQIATAAH
ncbi:hypothetical protein EVAR_44310_1 [Eumeta japonica]|uniref:Reverse transcriptase domain-containing protein n=1 Tax=Eumeta variegata TaxID=151549 RepID=A0A4C1WSL5_EUMVA|nr:hypothetical protein EVAR_44310_1 [Eumeta japonica]